MATAMVAVAEVLHLFGLGGAMSGSTPAPDAPFSQPEPAAQSADLTGQGVSTQPISSPRFWRRHFLTFLSITLTLACFVVVGIQSVAAVLPIESYSPVDGSLGGSDSLTTAVIGLCPHIPEYYTVANATHTPAGVEGNRATTVGPNNETNPSDEYDEQEAWLSTHTVITTTGKPKWENVDKLVNSKVVVTLKDFATPDTIDLDILSDANMTSSDNWKFETTGTCLNCVQGQIGKAEYFVTCRTEMYSKLEFDVRDSLSVPAGPNVTTINYKARLAITDHNGVDHPIGPVGTVWVHEIAGTPPGATGGLLHASGVTAIEKTPYVETTNRFLSLNIGSSDTGSAKATLFDSHLETTYVGQGRDATFTYDSGDATTRVTGTQVVELWMVPYCFINAHADPEDENTPVVETGTVAQYPGGGSTMPVVEWVALQVARQAGDVQGECVSTASPDSLSGGSSGSQSATVSATSGELASEAAPLNGSWTSGSTTHTVYSDGSYRSESHFSGSVIDPLTEVETAICKVCLRVFDECGGRIYSCCRTSIANGEGAFDPEPPEGEDCPPELVNPEPCDPN